MKRAHAATMLVRTIVALMCIVAGFGPWGRAAADDREQLADVRCIVVAMRSFSEGTPQQRGAEMMLAMYYFGRLDAEARGVDIAHLIERETEKMTLAQVRENATRCGKALVAKGLEIQEIGVNLSRKRRGPSE